MVQLQDLIIDCLREEFRVARNLIPQEDLGELKKRLDNMLTFSGKK